MGNPYPGGDGFSRLNNVNWSPVAMGTNYTDLPCETYVKTQPPACALVTLAGFVSATGDAAGAGARALFNQPNGGFVME